MNLFKNIVTSVAQKAVLKMVSERGGAIAMNLSDEAIGRSGREGVKKLANMGLLKLTPLLGESERYDVSLTDMGKKLVDQIVRSLKGAG